VILYITYIAIELLVFHVFELTIGVVAREVDIDLAHYVMHELHLKLITKVYICFSSVVISDSRESHELDRVLPRAVLINPHFII